MMKSTQENIFIKLTIKVLKIVFYLLFTAFAVALAFGTKELLNPRAVKIEPIKYAKRSSKNIILIGDSYAKTFYLKNSFPKIFDSIAKKHHYNFIDYTQSGSGFNIHRSLVQDSANRVSEQNIILYYFNIGDIADLKNGNSKTNISRNIKALKHKGSKNYNPMKYAFANSAFELLGISKSLYQHAHINIFEHPSKNSDLYQYSHLAYKAFGEELEKKLLSLNNHQNRIIIIVTYPFNFSIDKMQTWYVYQYFNKIQNKNIEVYQTIDMLQEIKDHDLSVSWRNGHPNQEAANCIAKKIDAILWNNFLP